MYKDEISQSLMRKIIDFIEESVFEYPCQTSELSILIPDYALRIISNSFMNMGNYYHNEPVTLMGIKTHPAFDNSVTLYCNDYQKVVNMNLPVYKLLLGEVTGNYIITEIYS